MCKFFYIKEETDDVCYLDRISSLLKISNFVVIYIKFSYFIVNRKTY